jgi:hypothetical protein
VEPENLGGQQHQARVQPDQQAGDDRVRQRRERIRSISYSRYRGTATTKTAAPLCSQRRSSAACFDQSDEG